MNYNNAHIKLQRERGFAREYECAGGCGKQAQQWAYQHNSVEEKFDESGSPYSENPVDYEPLCVSCHQSLDWAYSRPERRDVAREQGAHVGSVHASRLKEDPEYAARFLARVQENGRRSSSIQLELMKDPEYSARVRKNGKEHGAANLTKRYSCGECEVESHAGGIAHHQRSSGHVGRNPIFGL